MYIPRTEIEAGTGVRRVILSIGVHGSEIFVRHTCVQKKNPCVSQRGPGIRMKNKMAVESANKMAENMAVKPAIKLL